MVRVCLALDDTLRVKTNSIEPGSIAPHRRAFDVLSDEDHLLRLPSREHRGLI
jgi:hypothetical protein